MARFGGLEVEFVAASGRTAALLTLNARDVRPVADDDLACSIHARVFRVLCAPSPCPSPPPGARGSKRLPRLFEQEGQGEGGALFTHNAG